MTYQDFKRLAHLFRMASVAQDFPTVDLKLNTFWDAMREDLGLAKFLLLLQEYVKEETNKEEKDIIYP